MLVLGVYREKMFSPGRVEDDKRIMDETLRELRSLGYDVSAVSAEVLDGPLPDVACVLTMAQSNRALALLEQWSGTRIINAPPAVRGCRRTSLVMALDAAGLPLPSGKILSIDSGAEGSVPSPSSGHYWLKRGDVHRIEPDDVVKVTSEPELAKAIDHFRRHRVPKIVVQDHLDGEVVKFYGIRNGYFAGFGASGDGMERFTDLRLLAKRAAEAIGLDVYGGDAVITPDGRTVLIDLNAWPSFSRCCYNAAHHIAGYVAGMIADAAGPEVEKREEDASSAGRS